MYKIKTPEEEDHTHQNKLKHLILQQVEEFYPVPPCIACQSSVLASQPYLASASAS